MQIPLVSAAQGFHTSAAAPHNGGDLSFVCGVDRKILSFYGFYKSFFTMFSPCQKIVPNAVTIDSEICGLSRLTGTFFAGKDLFLSVFSNVVFKASVAQTKLHCA